MAQKNKATEEQLLKNRIAELTIVSSERKKTEDALKETEEKFRLAMSVTNDALWDWNIATNEVYRNSRHAEMLGYEPQELSSSQEEWVKRIHPDDKQRVFDAVSEHLKGKTQDIVIEYRLKKKSGDYIWVFGRGKAVASNDDGKPIRMIGVNIDITERKKAEEELRESEAVYRALVETTNTGYVISDKKGKVIDANKEYICLTGRAGLDEIRGRYVIEWTAGYDKEKNEKAVAKCVKYGYIRNFEVDYIDKHGKITPVEINATVVTIGGAFRILTLCRDITERKKAQEKLKIFSDAITSAFDYFILTDTQGNITYANESAIRTFGYTPKEFLKLGIVKLDADPEAAKKVTQEMAAKGKWSGEVINIKKNKETFPSLLSAFIIKDDKGNPKGTMGILRDITRLKESQESLRQSEQRYRILAESITDPIFVHGPEGRVVYLNQASARVLGKQPSDIIGKKMRIFYAKKEKKERLDSIQFVFRTKRSIVTEGTLEVEGEVRTFLVTIAPVFDSKGDVSAVVSIAHDVTELKKTEKNLTASKAGLEKQKLALERKNIALREIIEQVEIEKNKIKDDVLTNVSELTMPILKKLRAKGVTRKYIDLLSNRLQELASSLGRELTKGMLKLTPKEIEICNMIEGGLASKEIADFLNISYQTVEKHRKNIRKKLSLGHKKINLATYLQKRAKGKA